jgi:hypothetical protein
MSKPSGSQSRGYAQVTTAEAAVLTAVGCACTQSTRDGNSSLVAGSDFRDTTCADLAALWIARSSVPFELRIAAHTADVLMRGHGLGRRHSGSGLGAADALQ